jgi:predicted TPR repeat methyltransferase
LSNPEPAEHADDSRGPATVTMSLGEALRLGVEAHQNGDFRSAEQIYLEILRVKPGQQEALHYLGLLAFHVGQVELAAELISDACKSDPGYAEAFNNLGNVLMHLGDVELAEKIYSRALDLRPNLYDPLVNLTVVYSLSGRHLQAVSMAERAMRQMPESDSQERKELAEYLTTAPVEEASTRALVVLTRATLKPALLHSLGHSLASLGQTAEATRIYRQWASLDPTDPRPWHYISAVSQTSVPDQASPEFVKATFDRFASSFERILTHLKYSVPDLLRDSLAETLRDRRPCGEILDAGCGTGWCGPLLRPWARRLVGVDLSPNMLEKARERQVYDELLEEELVDHLNRFPGRYEVISAADVLEYFGNLAGVMRAARCGLQPGGRLQFTVEAAPSEETPNGYRLEQHGRYAHTEEYLRQTLADQQLSIDECRSVFLRTEGGRDVRGWLVLAHRPESSARHQKGRP